MIPTETPWPRRALVASLAMARGSFEASPSSVSSARNASSPTHATAKPWDGWPPEWAPPTQCSWASGGAASGRGPNGRGDDHEGPTKNFALQVSPTALFVFCFCLCFCLRFCSRHKTFFGVTFAPRPEELRHYPSAEEGGGGGSWLTGLCALPCLCGWRSKWVVGGGGGHHLRLPNVSEPERPCTVFPYHSEASRKDGIYTT